jgi:hypothetical protein
MAQGKIKGIRPRIKVPKSKPIKEESSFGILQPEKFKKVVVIGICSLFLITILFFISSLSSPKEEPVTSSQPQIQTTVLENGTIVSTENNEDTDLTIFDIPILTFVSIITGVYLAWRFFFGSRRYDTLDTPV